MVIYNKKKERILFSAFSPSMLASVDETGGIFPVILVSFFTSELPQGKKINPKRMSTPLKPT